METKGEVWIGVMGGGQLGRMLSLDARRMGYKVLTWTGGDRSGAAATADQLLDEQFDDQAALKKFTEKVNVATVEFETFLKLPLKQWNSTYRYIQVVKQFQYVSIENAKKLFSLKMVLVVRNLESPKISNHSNQDFWN